MQTAMSILDEIKTLMNSIRRVGAKSKLASIEQERDEALAKITLLKEEVQRLKGRARRVSPIADKLHEAEPALAEAAMEAFADQLDVATEGLKADLQSELDAPDFETRSFVAGLASSRRLFEGALNVAEAQKKKRREVACSSCGASTVYEKMAPNKVQSRLGEIGLQTAIYRCEGDEKCSERTRPRRLELSLAGKSLTEGAERLMVQLAAEMSFKRAAELLSEIWGMPVSAKRVERAAKFHSAYGSAKFHP